MALQHAPLVSKMLFYASNNTFKLRIDDDVIGLALRPIVVGFKQPNFEIVSLLLQSEVALKIGKTPKVLKTLPEENPYKTQGKGDN